MGGPEERPVLTGREGLRTVGLCLRRRRLSQEAAAAAMGVGWEEGLRSVWPVFRHVAKQLTSPEMTRSDLLNSFLKIVWGK